jgi:hypothetical protein
MDIPVETKLPILRAFHKTMYDPTWKYPCKPLLLVSPSSFKSSCHFRPSHILSMFIGTERWTGNVKYIGGRSRYGKVAAEKLKGQQLSS